MAFATIAGRLCKRYEASMPVTYESFNADAAPEAVGGYSQAVLVSHAARRLYISGQIPVAKDGAVPDTFELQAKLAWANVLAQLETAGMAIENLAKVTIFLSDRKYAAENRKARVEALGSHSPSLTVIITGIFDEAWLLEIEAIAEA
jgi:enamine deaminase RidA (YjgF/YER057c/UK114 family)